MNQYYSNVIQHGNETYSSALALQYIYLFHFSTKKNLSLVIIIVPHPQRWATGRDMLAMKMKMKLKVWQRERKLYSMMDNNKASKAKWCICSTRRETNEDKYLEQSDAQLIDYLFICNLDYTV